ncbi:hypothetical protein AGMMS49992_21880 [Clostridia bacterium]|nr:hypothetical protein AGMMS49992_21880 [Clostridia bacterium]
MVIMDLILVISIDSITHTPVRDDEYNHNNSSYLYINIYHFTLTVNSYFYILSINFYEIDGTIILCY